MTNPNAERLALADKIETIFIDEISLDERDLLLAALRAQPAEAGEPVAWQYRRPGYSCGTEMWVGCPRYFYDALREEMSRGLRVGYETRPLYASPQPAEVGAIVAETIERCARAVEAEYLGNDDDSEPINDPTDISYNFAIDHAAAAIRALNVASAEAFTDRRALWDTIYRAMLAAAPGTKP